jgi:hypothetical protein
MVDRPIEASKQASGSKSVIEKLRLLVSCSKVWRYHVKLLGLKLLEIMRRNPAN